MGVEHRGHLSTAEHDPGTTRIGGVNGGENGRCEWEVCMGVEHRRHLSTAEHDPGPTRIGGVNGGENGRCVLEV